MADEEVMESNDEKEITLRMKLQAEFDTRLENEVSEITKKLIDENNKNFTAQMKKIREEMAPPAEADIQKMLDQEYLEFKFKLVIRKGESQREKDFVIRELSQKAEKRMLKAIKTILVPVASEMQSISLNILDGDVAKKLIHLMNTFEPMLDVLAELAAISLDPYEEDEEVSGEWVKENLSSTKIVKVVTGQMEANYMRDFLSLLFRGTKLLQ